MTPEVLEGLGESRLGGDEGRGLAARHAVDRAHQSCATLIQGDSSHCLVQLARKVHDGPLRPRGAAGRVRAVAMWVLGELHAEELREHLEVAQRAPPAGQNGVPRGPTAGHVQTTVGTVVAARPRNPDVVRLKVPDKGKHAATIKVVVQITAVPVTNGDRPIAQAVQVLAEAALTRKNLHQEEDVRIQVKDGRLVAKPMCKV